MLKLLNILNLKQSNNILMKLTYLYGKDILWISQIFLIEAIFKKKYKIDIIIMMTKCKNLKSISI